MGRVVFLFIVALAVVVPTSVHAQVLLIEHPPSMSNDSTVMTELKTDCVVVGSKPANIIEDSDLEATPYTANWIQFHLSEYGTNYDNNFPFSGLPLDITLFYQVPGGPPSAVQIGTLYPGMNLVINQPLPEGSLLRTEARIHIEDPINMCNTYCGWEIDMTLSPWNSF